MSQPTSTQNPNNGYLQLGDGFQYPPGHQSIQLQSSSHQVVDDNAFNPPPQQQIRYSHIRRSTMQRRMQQQQELYQQEEQNNLNLNYDGQLQQEERMNKLQKLNNDVLVNLVIAMAVFIMVVSSNESCQRGWNAKEFMYIIASLYFIEVLLVLMQIKVLKTQIGENLCISFLRFVNFCTQVGFFISGNVGYYQNPDKSDCSSLNTKAFIVIIYGYLELLKCGCIVLFLMILIPILCCLSNQQQQPPQWMPAAPQFMQSLYKQKFNDFAKNHNDFVGNTDQDKKCTICYEEYQETDEITPLPCDERHFFHTACIEGWLQSNNSCPMCRKPITQAAIDEQRKKVLANQA